jgi:membrane associated rhomboid family serine protease
VEKVSESMTKETRKIYRCLLYPGLLVIFLWLIKIFEVTTQNDLSRFGIYPVTFKGLVGVLACPLLHADFSHLMANSVPLFFLGVMLLYFYREIAFKVFFLVWILTGFWVWCFARGEGVHIGASGVVYGLASFLFFSGIIRRETTLMSLALLIAFLYGGLVWGVFPQFFPHQRISWESHFMGLLAGVVLAIYYRKVGKQRKVYDWENDEEGDDGDDYYMNGLEDGEKPGDPAPPQPGGQPDNPDNPDTQPGAPPFRYTYKD